MTVLSQGAFVKKKGERIKIYKDFECDCIETWIINNKKKIEENFISHGGVLIRGLPIDSMSEFSKMIQQIFPSMLDYVYRSTPRTKLGGKIYTTTEYPANKWIPQHNENSYSNEWPSHIIFYCVVPPQAGGRTPLADSRKVLKDLDPKIVQKFEELGVMYVRNYTPGIDLSWQEVFQTESKEEVNAFCQNKGIDFTWNASGPELTTRQICQATYLHPVTQEKVWFNQAHLFHKSSLDPSEQNILLEVIGPDHFPRNTYYGNGEEIELDVLQAIRSTYEDNLFSFEWEKNDVLILDNVLTSHGREPYKGARKIAAAMA